MSIYIHNLDVPQDHVAQHIFISLGAKVGQMLNKFIDEYYFLIIIILPNYKIAKL